MEQALYLVETDQLAPLDYLHIINEINTLSEEELIEMVEEDLIEALAEGEITEEEFDLMLDEFENIDLDENYTQDVGDESGMQECSKCNEDDNIDEDLELDEGTVADAGKLLGGKAKEAAIAAANRSRWTSKLGKSFMSAAALAKKK
jgi:hypothetical protein